MKLFTKGLVAAMMVSLAPNVSAQSYDLFENKNNLGVTAGFKMTMPLGKTRSDRPQDKARMGLHLGLTKNYESHAWQAPRSKSADLFELGFGFDGQPNMLLSGQDIYTPLFKQNDTYGPQTYEGQTLSLTTGESILISVGAVAVVAVVIGLVVRDGVEDTIEDAFEPLQ